MKYVGVVTLVFLMMWPVTEKANATTVSLADTARAADARYGPLEDLVTSGTRTADWETRSAELRETLIKYFGEFPATRIDLKPRIISEQNVTGYTRQKVRYLT